MKKIFLFIILFLSACSLNNDPLIISNKISDEQLVQNRLNNIITSLDLEFVNVFTKDNHALVTIEHYKHGKLIKKIPLLESSKEGDSNTVKYNVNILSPDNKKVIVNTLLNKSAFGSEKIVFSKEYPFYDFSKIEGKLLIKPNEKIIMAYFGGNSNATPNTPKEVDKINLTDLQEMILITIYLK